MTRTHADRVLTLDEMAQMVFAWAARKGWEPSEDHFGDAIALIHSEASEALEAFRDWGLTDATRTVAVGRGDDGSDLPIANPKPEGVGSEFADILIRLLHYSARYGIDLEAEYHRKMAYNEGRPWRHGGRAL